MYNKEQLAELEEGWFYYDHAWQLLHHLIGKIEGNSLLDIGCGTGMALAIIKAAKPYLNVSGLEPSKDAENIWEARGLQVTVGSAISMPFRNEQFDTTLSSHVIEHIDDDFKALEEIIRVTRLRSIIVVPCGNVDAKNPGSPHLRYYNRQNFRSLISRAAGSYKFKTYSLPHQHIDNHIAVIDKQNV